ncbi:hypothetical protein BJY01DRAFT_254021 [Aspergillus pseudoustus]|uniref:NAD(P)-binding domain-containing protein n=1 Tax=Aspergillus pseudoustus TaxID=1810923 RepID=A0ABR4IX95_9EURO
MSAPLNVLVTGPTGTTGRAVVNELLNRGHCVTGFSKHPARYGAHPRYTPVTGSQLNDVSELVKVVEGHDVVISCFAPSHDTGPATYIGLVEGAWRLKEAVKDSSNSPYLIYVGGAGSLKDPETGLTTLDQPDHLIVRYFKTGPIEHLNWLRFVVGAWPIHLYYYVRNYAHANGWFSFLPRLLTSRFENHLSHHFRQTKGMPHACRAALSFFEHDPSFKWTFLSPPWFYRDGPRTGEYGVIRDFQPCDSKGRWLGVSNGDIAVGIVDEAEKREKIHLHWSVFAKQEDAAYFYDNYKGLTLPAHV